MQEAGVTTRLQALPPAPPVSLFVSKAVNKVHLAAR